MSIEAPNSRESTIVQDTEVEAHRYLFFSEVQDECESRIVNGEVSSKSRGETSHGEINHIQRSGDEAKNLCSMYDPLSCILDKSWDGTTNFDYELDNIRMSTAFIFETESNERNFHNKSENVPTPTLTEAEAEAAIYNYYYMDELQVSSIAIVKEYPKIVEGLLSVLQENLSQFQPQSGSLEDLVPTFEDISLLLSEAAFQSQIEHLSKDSLYEFARKIYGSIAHLLCQYYAGRKKAYHNRQQLEKEKHFKANPEGECVSGIEVKVNDGMEGTKRVRFASEIEDENSSDNEDDITYYFHVGDGRAIRSFDNNELEKDEETGRQSSKDDDDYDSYSDEELWMYNTFSGDETTEDSSHSSSDFQHCSPTDFNFKNINIECCDDKASSNGKAVHSGSDYFAVEHYLQLRSEQQRCHYSQGQSVHPLETQTSGPGIDL